MTDEHVSTQLKHAPGKKRDASKMRRNFAFLLGTATGACLAVLVMGPQGAHLVAAAKAAARPDIYAQLNLFGNVFERIKTSYIEKPDDSKLMEGAIKDRKST